MNRARLLLISLAAAALLVVGVACGGGDSEEIKLQVQAASALAEAIDQLHGELDGITEDLQGLQTRAGVAEEGINSFTATAAVHSLGRTAGIPEPPPGKVALRFSFDYLPNALAGEGLRVHVSSPEVNTVWAMESLAKGQPVPAGEPIKDSTVFLEPGESRMVTLVYENPSGEEIGFLGMPHQESPGSLHTKTWLTCFCLAFIYKAPAEGAWYRVIQAKVSPDMPPGSKVDALWTILTDPSVFPTE